MRLSLGGPDPFVAAEEANGNRWQVAVVCMIGEVRVVAHLHVDIMVRQGWLEHLVVSEVHYEHPRPNLLIAIATQKGVDVLPAALQAGTAHAGVGETVIEDPAGRCEGIQVLVGAVQQYLADIASIPGEAEIADQTFSLP